MNIAELIKGIASTTANRATEPSSWAGVTGLLVTAAQVAPVPAVQTGLYVAAAIASLVAIFKAEGKTP